MRKTLFWGIIGLLFYLLMYFFTDRAIDIWIHTHCADNWVYALGIFISYFAHGYFIICGIISSIFIAVVFDPERKKQWSKNLLLLCTAVSCAIFIGTVLKIILARYRPVMLFEHALYGFHFLSAKWAYNSTPSGHTLRAFSLFTALSIINRKNMPLYIFCAILIGVSRVAVTAHYPSDVIFGAYIGIFSALWVKHIFFPETDEKNTKTH